MASSPSGWHSRCWAIGANRIGDASRWPAGERGRVRQHWFARRLRNISIERQRVRLDKYRTQCAGSADSRHVQPGAPASQPGAHPAAWCWCRHGSHPPACGAAGGTAAAPPCSPAASTGRRCRWHSTRRPMGGRAYRYAWKAQQQPGAAYVPKVCVEQLAAGIGARWREPEGSLYPPVESAGAWHPPPAARGWSTAAAGPRPLRRQHPRQRRQRQSAGAGRATRSGQLQLL